MGRALPASVISKSVTAYSLKIKYALAALGIGALFAALLGCLLFWQHRTETDRLSTIAYSTVEGKLQGELERRGAEIAETAARHLARALADRPCEVGEVIATELLADEDVYGVELKDSRGALLFSASDNGAASVSRLVEISRESLPPGQFTGSIKPLGVLKISLSRSAIETSMQQLRSQMQ